MAQLEPTLKRLALYKPIRNSGTPIAADEHFSRVDGYMRVSCFVEVSFPPIGASDIESGELDRIQKQLETDHARKMQEIQDLRDRVVARVVQAEAHAGGGAP
jgi:hypothetical protein